MAILFTLMRSSPVCRTIQINGKQHYLWRAVDQDGEVVDVFLQAKRDGPAAKRFFRRLISSYQCEPRKIATDKLRSYGVAHRELTPEAIHGTSQYANNRAEQSHEATRVRERGMRGPASRKFKSTGQAQRFLNAHAAVYKLFTLRVQAILGGTWSKLGIIEILGKVRSLIDAERWLEVGR